MDGEEQGVTCYDWFFCTKKLSKADVENKLGK
jgi:peroxiredoxin (alkyl hydroperoxide reductase subunit C)